MADITGFQMPLFKRPYKKLNRNQQEATDQAKSIFTERVRFECFHAFEKSP